MIQAESITRIVTRCDLCLDENKSLVAATEPVSMPREWQKTIVQGVTIHVCPVCCDNIVNGRGVR